MSGGMVLAHKRGAERIIVLRQIVHRTAVLLGAASLLLGSALGAEVAQPAPFPVRDFNTYQPPAKATRIDAAEPPTIDGDLSDPLWRKAQTIDTSYQDNPNPWKPPATPTSR